MLTQVTVIKLLIFSPVAMEMGQGHQEAPQQWMLTLCTFKRYQVNSAIIVSFENAF